MKNSYQEKFGYRIERTAGKVKSQMAPWIQEVIKSPFCVLTTKGGTPGLVKVLNDKHFSFRT
jgi:hypothetical protein